MKKALLLSLFAASVMTAGCETTQSNNTTAAADKDQGEVITGSRIPRRGGDTSSSVSTMGQDAYKADRGTGGR